MKPLRSQRTGNSPDSPYSDGLVLLTWGHGLAPLWLVSRPLRNTRSAPVVGRVELDPAHAPGPGHGATPAVVGGAPVTGPWAARVSARRGVGRLGVGRLGVGRRAAGGCAGDDGAAAAQATGSTATAQAGGGGWAARDRVIGDWAGTDWPTGEQLATTKPPKGPRTEPQPALPNTSVQPSVQSSAQATRYQAAVQATNAAVGGAADGVPAGACRRPRCRRRCSRRRSRRAASGGWGTAGAQPTTMQAVGGQSGGGAGVDGTQVLFLGGDAWQVPGGPDGAAQANLYGYQEAQRRRRMWLIGGIGAGTAVAIAIIVVVASSMGGSSAATAADQTRVTTPPSPTASASAAAPASPTASAAAPSVSATPPASVLSDGQSGLSYSQLATPWTGGLPQRPGQRVPAGPRASPRSPGRSTAGRPPGTARRARARCRPSTTTPARPTWRTPRLTSRRPSATRTTPRSPTPRRRC